MTASGSWKRSIVHGSLLYAMTSLVAWSGVAFGKRFVTDAHPATAPASAESDPTAFLQRLVYWDGAFYADIAAHGYSYSPDHASNVAFFPGYPLLARGLMHLGLDVSAALVLVAQFALLAAFIVFHRYVSLRGADLPPDMPDLTLLCFGLFPPSFFFRVAYSESLFLLLAVTALYLLENGSSFVAALVIGAATGTRPVGVALVVPLALTLWRDSLTVGRFAARAVLPLAAAFWGLIAFIVFQGQTFREPLAFVKTQAHWSVGGLHAPWSVYDPQSPCCWGNFSPGVLPLNLWFANPIYFFGIAALVLVGASKRWLTPNEWLLAAGLLLIPLTLQGFRLCMTSHARFAAVVFPAYPIMARGLLSRPPSVSGVVFSASALLLAAYSALFAAHYDFY